MSNKGEISAEKMMKTRGNQSSIEESTKNVKKMIKTRGNQSSIEEPIISKSTVVKTRVKNQDKHKTKQLDDIVAETTSNKKILNEQSKSSEPERDSTDLDISKSKVLNEEENKQHNDQANNSEINVVSKKTKKNHIGIILVILLVFIVFGFFWTQKKIDDTFVTDYLKKGPTTVDEVESKVNDLVKGYLQNFAEAVNENSFQLLTPYIKKDSELYEQQKKYIPTIYARGIREEFVEYDMVEVTYDSDSQKGTVVVDEVYTIIKTVENTESTKEFINMYEFELDSATNEFLLSKLHLIQ